jgi:hypothetical protein
LPAAVDPAACAWAISLLTATRGRGHAVVTCLRLPAVRTAMDSRSRSTLQERLLNEQACACQSYAHWSAGFGYPAEPTSCPQVLIKLRIHVRTRLALQPIAAAHKRHGTGCPPDGMGRDHSARHTLCGPQQQPDSNSRPVLLWYTLTHRPSNDEQASTQCQQSKCNHSPPRESQGGVAPRLPTNAAQGAPPPRPHPLKR